jgi:hypothetical protein
MSKIETMDTVLPLPICPCRMNSNRRNYTTVEQMHPFEININISSASGRMETLDPHLHGGRQTRPGEIDTIGLGERLHHWPANAGVQQTIFAMTLFSDIYFCSKISFIL